MVVMCSEVSLLAIMHIQVFTVLLLWSSTYAFVLQPSANVVHFQHDVDVIRAWNTFVKQYDKQYDTEEEKNYRKDVFIKGLQTIDNHNRLARKGLRTFFMGTNKYSDMTHAEFVSIMNGFKPDLQNRTFHHPTSHVPQHSVSVLPEEMDWRKHGYVTPVKDQGHCGSCWAFSSTGALEGQTFNKTRVLVSLSEQNLVDCSLVWGNNGCQGGLMDNSFKYIADNNGIDTEVSYPYTAKDGNCHYSAESKGASDTGSVDLPKGDESELKRAVATIGPISVAIDASQESFQYYKTGIYNELSCTDRLDHAVLVVGYGTLGTQDYWLVKNSWGTSWGDAGYILMSRNLDNQCGIASMASYPAL